MNKPLAQALLQGKRGQQADADLYDYNFVDLVVQAFGAQPDVYLGGPDLPGTRELASGTGI